MSDKRPAAPPATPPATELDQVRDLLFGESVRRFERQFQELNERLDREFSQLRADLQTRAQTLESSAKEKFEAAHQRLTNTEQALRFFTNEQTSELRRVFTERHDGLQQELQSMLARLSDRTTDRTVLSQLLQDMAGRLSDDARG